MRIARNFRVDQDLIIRFLDVFGGGAAILSGNKQARPGFFIFAHTFIQEYIEAGFFKKEELLIETLKNNGFSQEEGPVGAMLAEQKKSRDAAEHLLSAVKGWQGGDEEARVEVGWAASEYTATLRQHLDRLKNLIFPLLEQNISPEDERRISEGLNKIAFENNLKDDADRFTKLLESLEEELSDWR
ncbi:MAG TPA: hemerythrin domain-containing protein [Anaerolineales bacterium]|nr:hemerythrin domain-containing protein [Anaerolineales bacterium]